jgi:hypothetical protein
MPDPLFNACPTALNGSKIAVWKHAGETTSWTDLSGTYTLGHTNTPQVQRYQKGRTLGGSMSRHLHENIEYWTTTDSGLLLNGSDFTWAIVHYHTLPDFDSPASRVSPALYDTGAVMLSNITTSSVSAPFVQTQINGSTLTTARTFDFDEHVLAVIKNDAGTDVIYQWWSIETATKLQEVVRAGSLNNRTTLQFGRLGTSPGPVADGTETLIDMMQLHDSVLSDANIEAICNHIWNNWLATRTFIDSVERAKGLSL